MTTAPPNAWTGHRASPGLAGPGGAPPTDPAYATASVRLAAARAGACCAVLVCLAAVLSATPAGATESFLSPIGPTAAGQREHFGVVIALIMIAVLPVLIGTPLLFWFYRRGNAKARYAPTWEFNSWLEIAMWAVPTISVAAMAVMLVQATHKLDPYRPLSGQPVRVDVIGLDWKWLFLYRDLGLASVGELVVPVGQPVSLRLTSDTVMQSFWVPEVAGQIYAMPGMRTELNLLVDREATTRGENTQYNGSGFPHQEFVVRAVSEADFAAWAQADENAPALTEDTYRTVAKQSILSGLRTDLGLEGDGPIKFALGAPSLFDQVIARYRGTAPVTHEAQPGSPEYRIEASLLPGPDEVWTALSCGPVVAPIASVWEANDG